MLVPHRNTANLLMQVAMRGGRQSVNRRYMPPMSAFKPLIDRGMVTVGREGSRKCRTTILTITPKGRAESLRLASRYKIDPSRLTDPAAPKE